MFRNKMNSMEGEWAWTVSNRCCMYRRSTQHTQTYTKTHTDSDNSGFACNKCWLVQMFILFYLGNSCRYNGCLHSTAYSYKLINSWYWVCHAENCDVQIRFGGCVIWLFRLLCTRCLGYWSLVTGGWLLPLHVAKPMMTANAVRRIKPIDARNDKYNMLVT